MKVPYKYKFLLGLQCMQCAGVSSPEDCLTKVTCPDQYVSLYISTFFFLIFNKIVSKSQRVHEIIIRQCKNIFTIDMLCNTKGLQNQIQIQNHKLIPVCRI